MARPPHFAAGTCVRHNGLVTTLDSTTAPAVDPQSSRDADAKRGRIDAPNTIELVPFAALALGALVTILSFGSSWVHLAYHLPRLHAVIDTTIGLVSLLLAYLVYGRVQALGRQRDSVLAFALGLAGFVNLFAAVTQGVAAGPPDRFAVWVPTIGRLLVAVLFATAALMPAAPIRQEMGFWSLAVAISIPFLGLMAIVGILSDQLPWSSELSRSPTDTTKPIFVGPGLLILAQLLILISFVLAAAGFSHRRRGRRRSHDLARVGLHALCVRELRLLRVPVDLLGLDLRR